MASDLDAAEATIVQRVSDQWDAQNDGPVAYPGVSFDPPENGGPWMRLTILWGDGDELTMGQAGSGQNRVTGVAVLDLFEKPGDGDGDLKARADRARDLFNRKLLSGVRFRPSSGPGRPREDRDGWLTVAVSTPFTVHETI